MTERFRSLSIIDILNLSFLVILTFFSFFAIHDSPYRLSIVILLTFLYFYLFTMPSLRPVSALVKPGRRFLMFIYPVIFLFSVFESFFMILPYFNSNRFDLLMSGIDLFMLGIHPTVWIEQIIHPVFTEVLYFAYAFYFPMPLILVGWMYKKQMLPEIIRIFFIFFLCYYGAYISYFIFPVQGPRFFLADLQTIPLDGIWIAEKIRNLINFMEPNKLDAFPSLHAAILLLTMLGARKHSRRMYLIFLPIAVLITISLVYLRYHYVIDVIAGMVWAGFCWIIGARIYDKYWRKFMYHFSRESM